MVLLETERLIIRQIELADLDIMYQLDTDPKVMKYIWTCHSKPLSKEEELGRIQKAILDYSKNPGLGVFTTIDRESASIIGWTALIELDNSGQIEIGYRYFQKFWGKGYATEATTAMRNHGFTNADLDKIVAVTHPENDDSQHVLKKIGLTYKGKAHYYKVDVDFFELLKKDWECL